MCYQDPNLKRWPLCFKSKSCSEEEGKDLVIQLSIYVDQEDLKKKQRGGIQQEENMGISSNNAN